MPAKNHILAGGGRNFAITGNGKIACVVGIGCDDGSNLSVNVPVQLADVMIPSVAATNAT